MSKKLNYEPINGLDSRHVYLIATALGYAAAAVYATDRVCLLDQLEKIIKHTHIPNNDFVTINIKKKKKNE